ncbi:carboxypeptidase Y [Coniophora puteana RWD-64-598 SS2]|uniref:Carboxypeptidase n=1 Tax=Coniophora puteana (strain RWD-64-598) TaxID=741705 RepID=A0A5M3M8X6_CONPW|nr:carboxypeptidase Y [Coniophora puteana RWD-64-598 SS2]EIW75294.1 carboxypeptidase Y [Coniophora puteana RWD-64-598 SS2]
MFSTSLVYASQSPLASLFDVFTKSSDGPTNDPFPQASTNSTILKYPDTPGYGVRARESRFCDGTVKTHTGYIDIGSRHLFFYYFESRGQPATDDVIMWIQGGPGGSGSVGLFMENGPCRAITPDGEISYHSDSWNTNANVIYIDQPVGVGFSYSDAGETISTTDAAAKDIATSIALLFDHFELGDRAFHIAGESYGGRYVPMFASTLYDQNRRLLAQGFGTVNLKSVMIGNGSPDWASLINSFVDFQCSIAPVQSISKCVKMKSLESRVQRWMSASCIETFDEISCGAAQKAGWDEFVNAYGETGLNYYDYTKECEGGAEQSCYFLFTYMEKYLNRTDVRESINVDSSFSGGFNISSQGVMDAFVSNFDQGHSSMPYVAQLLERGIRVLIYAGENDFICNTRSQELWMSSMEWSGKDVFAVQNVRSWEVDGKAAGKTKNAHALTYATIAGAGHMAPYDKPRETLEMLERWLTVKNL